MADETALLVSDAYLDGRYLVVVADAEGFSPKMVALLGTRDVHDAVADADGELASGVHQGGYGEVGQRKQRASLTDVGTIQVACCHYHFCHCMFCVHFCYLATSVGCKSVCTIQ